MIHPCCHIHQYFVSFYCRVVSIGWISYNVIIYKLMDIWIVSNFWLLWKLCYDHLYKFLCEYIFPFFLEKITSSSIIFSYNKYTLNFIIIMLWNFFNMTILDYIPTAINECCGCFISSPTLSIVSLFNFSHSSRWAMVSCYFNFYFSDDWKCCTYFSGLIYYLYPLFTKFHAPTFHIFFK